MSLTLTVKLHKVGELRQISDTMAVQEFVVLDDSNAQYPQHVTFQVKNSNIAMLQSLQIGQQITVHFNLRGREFVKDGQNKYFNTLEAWKIV